ncbi:MAG TPA: ZIP family metal transporter [Gemmatimonadales bacterium]|nr:ZIP family metal transporter [Gemmatimonadales bacterium]
MTALGLALAAAAGNLIGAMAVVRRQRRGLALIEGFVAFGAGFMLAVMLLEVTPEVLEAGSDGAIYILAGYFAVHVAQHVVVPHFHFGEETHPVSRRAGVSALCGLLLHTFFDGVAIASGFLVSRELGLLLFLAVLLHKLPEGVTMASLMLAGGQGRRRALGAAGALGVATVAGVLLTEQLALLARYGLAISAGVTLYVAASNLVPEFQAKRGWRLPLAFLGGAAAFFATRLLVDGVLS